jgi:flavin reductase (DIM6/NTAB) family NADH-FMN oxidoreductase RutF
VGVDALGWCRILGEPMSQRCRASDTMLAAFDFRQAASRFATGVAVVTVAVLGAPVGMTVSSLTSVSLEPPLLLVCLQRRSRSAALFREADYFGINVLFSHQRELSERFANFAGNRFQGVSWARGSTGVPLLNDALATFECRRHTCLPGGDHDIVTGEVLHVTARSGMPLVRFSSAYHELKVPIETAEPLLTTVLASDHRLRLVD